MKKSKNTQSNVTNNCSNNVKSCKSNNVKGSKNNLKNCKSNNVNSNMGFDKSFELDENNEHSFELR